MLCLTNLITLVPILRKFPISFSLLVKNVCFHLASCENFQYPIAFNEISESVDELQIRVNLANREIKRLSSYRI